MNNYYVFSEINVPEAYKLNLLKLPLDVFNMNEYYYDRIKNQIICCEEHRYWFIAPSDIADRLYFINGKDIEKFKSS